MMARHPVECPKCGIELIETEHAGVLHERCRSCHGVWLDHLALRAWLDEKVGSSTDDPVAEIATLVDSTETRLSCPRCSRALMASKRTGITIEWCRGCRGLFLDHQELDRVEDWRETVLRQRRRQTFKDSVIAFLEFLYDLGSRFPEEDLMRKRTKHRKLDEL